MQFLYIFLIFLASIRLGTAAPTGSNYGEQFLSVMSDITQELQNNANGTDISQSLTHITELIAKVEHKYQNKPHLLYILKSLFELKLDQIKTHDTIPVEVHIANIEDALKYALKRSPSDYYTKALRYIKKMTQEELSNLSTRITNLRSRNVDTHSLHKRAEARFPVTERLLANLALMFALGSTLLDACGNVSQSVCHIFLGMSVVAMGFWVVDTTRVVLGVGELNVRDMIFPRLPGNQGQ